MAKEGTKISFYWCYPDTLHVAAPALIGADCFLNGMLGGPGRLSKWIMHGDNWGYNMSCMAHTSLMEIIQAFGFRTTRVRIQQTICREPSVRHKANFLSGEVVTITAASPPHHKYLPWLTWGKITFSGCGSLSLGCSLICPGFWAESLKPGVPSKEGQFMSQNLFILMLTFLHP